MGTKNVDIMIPEELVPYLYTIKDGKTVSEKVTFSVVVGLFASKVITLEKAAELAGKSIWDFVDILNEYQIPWAEYDEEDLQMDDMVMEKITGGFYE